MRDDLRDILKFLWWNDQCLSLGPILLIGAVVTLVLWVVAR